MSYRAFKRLLGETSLERKCRFLFGAGILLLITLSFWLYAYQTEHIAYDQAVTSCRLLVTPILVQHHVPYLRAKMDKLEGKQLQAALTMLNAAMLREQGKDYQYHILNQNQFDDSFEQNLFKEFLRGDGRVDESRLKPNEQVLLYYAPIRAGKDCLVCHQKLASEKGLASLAENDLLGMVRVRMPTRAIEEGVHWNRAVLMATALATALLIMAGSWIIIRYIIVKPVKHLKDVSDAIS